MVVINSVRSPSICLSHVVSKCQQIIQFFQQILRIKRNFGNSIRVTSTAGDVVNTIKASGQ